MPDENTYRESAAALADTDMAVRSPGGGSEDAALDAAASAVAPTAPPLERVGAGWITLLALVNFGSNMATLVAPTYALAVRIGQLAPQHQEYLGVLVSIASVIVVVWNPLLGVLSDRSRTRLGSRRPFMIGGAVVGILGLALMGIAPNVLVLAIGWAIAAPGFGTVSSCIGFLVADRVPDAQRGRVSALVGLTSQLAPVVGVLLAFAVASNTLLLFTFPGFVAIVLLLPFLLGTRDPQNTTPRPQVDLKKVLTSFVFNPRRYPNFAWNWLGRFIFFVGLFMNTTFTTFFYAQRLGIPTVQVAGVTAILSTAGIPLAIAVSVLSGFLSDKFGRRIFIAIGTVLFASGALLEAFAVNLPMLAAGSLVMTAAISSFSVVDQAITISVLPSRAEAGRYLGIMGYAQKLPNAIAPLIGSLLITIGATGVDKNYTLAYLVGGGFAIVGGLLIVFKVRMTKAA